MGVAMIKAFSEFQRDGQEWILPQGIELTVTSVSQNNQSNVWEICLQNEELMLNGHG